MPEPGGSLRMRKVIFHYTVLSSVLLGAIGFTVTAEAATLSPLPHGSQMPVIKVLGCRIHGLGIVCNPGVVLPKRLRKERYHQEEAEPTYKGQSEKMPSAKGGSASTKGSSSATNGSQKDTVEQPGGAGGHTCPPGNVVLEKPDAKGSYCEPVAGQSSGAQAGQSGEAGSQMDKPSVTGTPGSTNSQTGAAAGGAESSANGGAPALGTVPAASTPTQSSGSYCCSAPTTSNGQPASSLQACGTDQSSALTALVSAAAQKDVTLGDAQCGAR